MHFLPKQRLAKVSDLWLAAFLISLPANSPAQIVELTFYPVPGPAAGAITSGPDGALWFTGWDTDKIGRITRTGVLTEFPLPPGSGLWGITKGPDGALWFTERRRNKIGRITTEGTITEFDLPSPDSWPANIVPGPDGALWFTLHALPRRIGRITTGGAVTLYPVNAPPEFDVWPTHTIVPGPDGALWFTGADAGYVGRITTAGTVTLLDRYLSCGGSWITAAPDGTLWLGRYSVCRITTSGEITEYTLPPTAYAIGGTVGADGAIWFTQTQPQTDPFAIGRITATGAYTAYTVPYLVNEQLGDIAAGPDGALWFTTSTRVGRLRFTFAPDSSRPISQVSPGPAIAGPVFPVAWTGSDTGSGIRDFTIYVSDNGQPFRVWLQHTLLSQSIFNGLAGHTYGFYSIARDFTGNEETPKAVPERTTRVTIEDPNNDGRVDCADVAIVKSAFGKRTGQTGFDARADINRDGVVDVRDLSLILRQLPPRTVCP